MKKIYLAAISALFATSAFSQINFGAQVSANLSSASFTSEEGINYKKTPAAGFGIAVAAEVPLSGNLSLRSSLGLLQKGVTVKMSSEDDVIGKIEGKFTNKMYYAELPLNFTVSKEVSGGKFFAGAGPSIGFGLFGKSKGSYTVSFPGMPSETETQSTDIFKSEDGEGYKRLDLSASFIAGMQFSSGMYVNAGYLLGLNNALPKDAEGSYKNRGLQLTIGMFLKK